MGCVKGGLTAAIRRAMQRRMSDDDPWPTIDDLAHRLEKGVLAVAADDRAACPGRPA